MAAPVRAGGDVVIDTAAHARVHAISDLVASVPDPEIPILTLADLGILRNVHGDDHGHVVVTITPTYSGCPAIDPIRAEVERVLAAAGYDDVELRTVLGPAWTTDWISDEAREKLRRYGIAPPERASPDGACLLLAHAPRCPRCGSEDTREVSPFGSTPCQSHHVCNGCLEPFDRFKTLR